MLITKHVLGTLKDFSTQQKILKKYKLNILNTAIYMRNVYGETVPVTFFELFQKVSNL